MPQTPEIQNPQTTQHSPENLGVNEIPSSPDIPPETVRQAQISVTQQQFTAQVTDDSGNPLINTPQTKTVAIEVPAINKSQLSVMSEGSQEDSSTWWAAFWDRLILKAEWFRWNIFFKRNS